MQVIHFRYTQTYTVHKDSTRVQKLLLFEKFLKMINLSSPSNHSNNSYSAIPWSSKIHFRYIFFFLPFFGSSIRQKGRWCLRNCIVKSMTESPHLYLLVSLQTKAFSATRHKDTAVIFRGNKQHRLSHKYMDNLIIKNY